MDRHGRPVDWSFARIVVMLVLTTCLIWGFAAAALAGDRDREGLIFPPMFNQVGTAVLTTQPAPRPSVSPDFAGFGWGVGFSFTDSLFSDLVNPEDVIIDARGFVRVSRFNNVAAGMVFESHVTFQTFDSVAIGPYFSVTPGTEDLVKAVGLGIMFELNRPRLNAVTGLLEPSPVSFNLGIGVNILFNAFVLREGYKDGMFAPGTTPTVEREKAVLQLMTTVGF